MYNFDRTWYIFWPIEVGSKLLELGLDTWEVEAMFRAAGTRRTPGREGTIDAVGTTGSGRVLWLVVERDSNDGMLVMKEIVELSPEDLADISR